MAGGIAPAVVRLNAAVPFLGIELFDRALRHRVILHAIRRSTPRGPECVANWKYRKCDGVA
jgi:hypothetical protein